MKRRLRHAVSSGQLVHTKKQKILKAHVRLLAHNQHPDEQRNAVIMINQNELIWEKLWFFNRWYQRFTRSFAVVIQFCNAEITLNSTCTKTQAGLQSFRYDARYDVIRRFRFCKTCTSSWLLANKSSCEVDFL